MAETAQEASQMKKSGIHHPIYKPRYMSRCCAHLHDGLRPWNYQPNMKYPVKPVDGAKEKTMEIQKDIPHRPQGVQPARLRPRGNLVIISDFPQKKKQKETLPHIPLPPNNVRCTRLPKVFAPVENLSQKKPREMPRHIPRPPEGVRPAKLLARRNIPVVSGFSRKEKTMEIQKDIPHRPQGVQPARLRPRKNLVIISDFPQKKKQKQKETLPHIPDPPNNVRCTRLSKIYAPVENLSQKKRPMQFLPPLVNKPIGVKLAVKPTWEATFCRAGLSQTLHKPSKGFDLEDPNMLLFKPEYNKLHDKSLEDYVHHPQRMKFLKKEGYITSDNKVTCSLAEYNKYNDYLKRVKVFNARKCGGTKHALTKGCVREKNSAVLKDVEASRNELVSKKPLEKTGSSKVNLDSSDITCSKGRQKGPKHFLPSIDNQPMVAKSHVKPKPRETSSPAHVSQKHALTKGCVREKNSAVVKDVEASRNELVSKKPLEKSGSSKVNLDSSDITCSKGRQNFSHLVMSRRKEALKKKALPNKDMEIKGMVSNIDEEIKKSNLTLGTYLKLLNDKFISHAKSSTERIRDDAKKRALAVIYRESTEDELSHYKEYTTIKVPDPVEVTCLENAEPEEDATMKVPDLVEVTWLEISEPEAVVENQSSPSFQTDINSKKEDRLRSSSSSSSSIPESCKGFNMIAKLKNLTRKKSTTDHEGMDTSTDGEVNTGKVKSRKKRSFLNRLRKRMLKLFSKRRSSSEEDEEVKSD